MTPPITLAEAAATAGPCERLHGAGPMAEAAREVGTIAHEIRDLSAEVTSMLTDRELLATVARAPRAGVRALAGIGHALNCPGGLGSALIGGALGRTLGKAGAAMGRESLAALVAATSLRLRITAVSRQHPELHQLAGLRRLIEAISDDRQVEAVRAFRALMAELGAGGALAATAPIITELSALVALLDENPANDAFGWEVVTGTPLSTEGLAGVSLDWVAGLDVGEGRADPGSLTADEVARLSTDGSIVGHVRDIQLLGCTGRILLRTVECPDGATRFVLLLPGMARGAPRNDSPQDLVGAVRNTRLADSPYTRGIRKALDHAGVPNGAELAIIAHSEGGVAGMNLVQDPDFARCYAVTHVVAVGAPVDFKRPADPGTWVASITNHHDIVPSLDGQGPGSPHHLHPDWYVVDFTDTTHKFPLCHSAARYADNLEHTVPAARDHIDAALSLYRGTPRINAVYTLHDD